MTALDTLRYLRDRSSVLRAAHAVLREPYYYLLGIFYPRGVEVELPNRCRVKLHSRLMGMRPEEYEPAIGALLERHASQTMTAIDVGAHVGLHTLRLIQSVGPGGRVVAVEPSPANAGLLRRHLDWNECRNVTVVEAAVGEKECEIDFAFRPDPLDPGGFANSIAYDIVGTIAKIRMTTIDVICADLTPDLIKIDVEGAEMLVVKGAHETLSKASPVLVVAFHPDAMRLLGTSPVQLVQFLDTLGYSGRHLDGRDATEPTFEEIIFKKRRAAG